MSRKAAGALALVTGCGVALVGLLPKTAEPARDARRLAQHKTAAARPGAAEAARDARLRT